MNRDDWPGHGSKYDRVPGQPGETFLHDFTVAESQNDVRSLIEERLTWSVRAVLLGGGSPRATSYQIKRKKPSLSQSYLGTVCWIPYCLEEGSASKSAAF